MSGHPWLSIHSQELIGCSALSGWAFWLVSGQEQLFYWGEARCLIFCWVEEVGSLLPAGVVCGVEGQSGGDVHSASALGLILVASRTHLPVQHTHRGSLQSCPVWGGGWGGVGVCQVSGVGLARDLL